MSHKTIYRCDACLVVIKEGDINLSVNRTPFDLCDSCYEEFRKLVREHKSHPSVDEEEKARG